MSPQIVAGYVSVDRTSYFIAVVNRKEKKEWLWRWAYCLVAARTVTRENVVALCSTGARNDYPGSAAGRARYRSCDQSRNRPRVTLHKHQQVDKLSVLQWIFRLQLPWTRCHDTRQDDHNLGHHLLVHSSPSTSFSFTLSLFAPALERNQLFNFVCQIRQKSYIKFTCVMTNKWSID